MRPPVFSLLAVSAMLTLPAAANEPPADGVGLLKRAVELRRQAEATRSDADTRHQAAQAECYRKVLVNDCLESARKRRTASMIEARQLESEARSVEQAVRREEAESHALKRREAADRRLQEAREQAERNRQAQEEALERLSRRRTGDAPPGSTP